MSSKAGKRPLRSLTAHEKLEAIRRVHDGESKASVARDIGVPESTLRGWCKNEDKISYLSRQSSPDTDESAPGNEPKEKKPKLEEVLQPYNLSMKTNGLTTNSPISDYDTTNAVNIAAATTTTTTTARSPLNLNAVKTADISNKTERERNRAELARLSIELGLNRPEMFLPNITTNNNITELTNNIGLLAQWNTLLMQKMQQNKIDTNVTGSYSGLTEQQQQQQQQQPKPYKHKPKMESPKNIDESVWYWLKTQPTMGLAQNPITANPNVSSSTSGFNPDVTTDQNSSWFWKWYKQFASSYPLQQLPDKPILYQQLTKDKEYNCENIKLDEKQQIQPAIQKTGGTSNSNKARAVLDNLLFNNNNNNLSMNKRDVQDEMLSQNEALEHGEKFLEWLECCSEPSVTAVQIMQFRYLLNNIKNGADRKNNELQNKAKVKRK